MRSLLIALTATTLIALTAVPSQAADHTDAPGSIADPAADVNDLYIFVNPNDADETVAIMTVFPLADGTSLFSDAVEYVFTIENDNGDDFEIVCTFAVSQDVTCAGAGLSVTGAAGGIRTNGDIRVWVGLRDDPFYFDLAAFQATVEAGSPQFDEVGTNFFAGLNTLAIVVGIQSDALTNTGANPVLRTYASTRRIEE